MPTPAPFHIASPMHGHGGPNLCGAPRDPDAQYGGLDGAYRAQVGGWADTVPPVCPDCLRVAVIAMGAERRPPEAAPAPDPSVPAPGPGPSATAAPAPPELAAEASALADEMMQQWRLLAARHPPRLVEGPPRAPAALTAALRAELQTEWNQAPGRIEVMPSGLPHATENALRAVLLFHSAEPWTPERRAEWLALTGREDATTRALCDTVRAVLGDAGEDRV